MPTLIVGGIILVALFMAIRAIKKGKGSSCSNCPMNGQCGGCNHHCEH